jgi:V8-like Glu-specific endopeptidase
MASRNHYDQFKLAAGNGLFIDTDMEGLKMRKSLYLFVFVILTSGLVAAGQIEESAVSNVINVEGYRAPGVYDAEAAEREQAALSEWLVSQQSSEALLHPLSVEVTSEELAVMENNGPSDRTVSKMLVGVTKTLGAFVDLEAPEVGAASTTAQSVHVWTGAVRSQGASALRIHFTDFALPEGGELYVYNEHGEAFGPYSGLGLHGNGDFWSHTITGTTLLVQAHTPVGAPHGFFTIAEVAHFGADFAYAQYRQRSDAKSFCSYNAECVEPNNGTDDSIAHYSFIQRPYVYICSGGLIATEPPSSTPYFLTANHCVSRDRIAGTVETYFFYTSSNGGCSGPVAQHNVGSSVVATNKTGDFTLLRLDGSAPTGSAFLGWTTEEVAFTGGYDLHRVSHPKGAPQAYSEHSVDAVTGTCTSWPRGSWIYSRDTFGATEGGSSGSPVVNSQGLVVGQLSGACGYNLNDVCDSASNATVDGAFASYYSQVAPWLAPGGGCTDNDGDGSCVEDDCDDNDPFNFPGNDESCDDGQDNDCDTLVDYDDPDCDMTCLPRGAPCTTGDECCSLACHPRKLTCK